MLRCTLFGGGVILDLGMSGGMAIDKAERAKTRDGGGGGGGGVGVGVGLEEKKRLNRRVETMSAGEGEGDLKALEGARAVAGVFAAMDGSGGSGDKGGLVEGSEGLRLMAISHDV